MKLFDVYPLYDVTPVSAKDVYVYDENGTQYLDLYGGHAVISIGHNHSHYVQTIECQLGQIGFYSNAVHNPLQHEVAEHLETISGCNDYQLFMVNSGAEANENALKLASFATGKSRVIAFNNGFHGRTSAAVAATDNPNIIAPLNAQQHVTFIALGDIETVQAELEKGDVCAVIIEFIQGVGGLDEATAQFYQELAALCTKSKVKLIADEVQSGFGRTGNFFAFQKYNVTPDIITMAKGMGNGFPVGGLLIHSSIKAVYGMLGTTFGGNHLACVAVKAVLDVIMKEKLIAHSLTMEACFRGKATMQSGILRVKGRGLMLGLEFPFPVAELRKKLIYDHHIFTGGAKDKNVLRILPPLTIQPEHFDQFFNALEKEL